MITRSSTLRWLLAGSMGLGVVLAIAYLGGVSLLSAPRKPPAPAAVVVVDANGNTVGSVADIDDNLMTPVVIINTSAGEVGFRVYSDRLTSAYGYPGQQQELMYPEENCAGTPYIVAGVDIEHSVLRRATVFAPDQNLYVAGTTREMAVIQSRREALAGICSPYSYSDRDFVQAVAVGNIYQQYPPPYSLR